VAKFSGGKNCILLSESQGLAYYVWPSLFQFAKTAVQVQY